MANELVILRSFNEENTFGSGKVIERMFRDFMEDVAEQAKRYLTEEVPVFEGHMMSHIDATRVKKKGTIYTVSVGILPIHGSDDPDYPKYVEEGSGEWFRGGRTSQGTFITGGNLAAKGGDAIVPLHGNFLEFVINKGPNAGKRIRTRSVKGQEGQFFMTKAARKTNEYIKLKKRELAQEIKALT